MQNTNNKLSRLARVVSSIVLVFSVLVSSVFAVADTMPPTDVSNLEAVAGDGEVRLSWDVATDNVGVSGYRVYYGLESVTSEGGQYAFESNAGDAISHTVADLENGVEYFFAVTAYDEQGNESVNYSLEASATPMKATVDAVQPVVEGDDGRSPTVLSSESYSATQIKVEFSEAVSLPSVSPENAFLVEDNLTGDFLEVIGAEVLEDDNKVVILETLTQEVGTEYIITAGITVEDLYGNSIRSGTSDTATFLGSDGPYIPVNEADVIPMPAPAVEGTDTPTETPEVVELEIEDILAPEEITEFLSELNDSIVVLTWTVSVSEDVVEQVLYKSEDGEDYAEIAVLPPLASEYELEDLVEGITYFFKLTSKDSAGNESEGVVIEVALPETGPGLALMLGLSAIGTAFASRKKRS